MPLRLDGTQKPPAWTRLLPPNNACIPKRKRLTPGQPRTAPNPCRHRLAIQCSIGRDRPSPDSSANTSHRVTCSISTKRQPRPPSGTKPRLGWSATSKELDTCTRHWRALLRALCSRTPATCPRGCHQPPGTDSACSAMTLSRGWDNVLLPTNFSSSQTPVSSSSGPKTASATATAASSTWAIFFFRSGVVAVRAQAQDSVKIHSAAH